MKNLWSIPIWEADKPKVRTLWVLKLDLKTVFNDWMFYLVYYERGNNTYEQTFFKNGSETERIFIICVESQLFINWALVYNN